jgi:hypothetical protein
MTDLNVTIPTTFPVKVKTHGMWLANAGASIDEGKYAGTTYVTSAGGGQPCLYFKREGESQSAYIPLQDLIAGMIKAVEAALEAAAEPAVDNPDGD